MLEAGGETVIQLMCGLCNQVLESDVVPNDWKDWTIVCIPQKGNCDNWRGVALLSILGKVYCQMILNHMHDVVDAELHEEQVGFRPKWSCAEQISPYSASQKNVTNTTFNLLSALSTDQCFG